MGGSGREVRVMSLVIWSVEALVDLGLRLRGSLSRVPIAGVHASGCDLDLPSI